MSTIVTKLPLSVATTLNLTPGSHRNWAFMESALTDNDFESYVDFGDSGTGDNVSNYLYLNTFNFNVPSTTKIDGITVEFEKRGVGLVQDHQIRLVRDNLQYSISKNTLSNWPATQQLTTYGGPNDLWNRNWTASEINHPNFGFVIAVQGSIGNSSAAVDYGQITLNYHQEYNEIGSGGCKSNGNNAILKSNSPSLTGGSRVKGVALLPVYVQISGGLKSSGLSRVSSLIVTKGGLLTQSSAIAKATNYIVGKQGVKLAGKSTSVFDNTSISGNKVSGKIDEKFVYNIVGQGGTLPGGKANAGDDAEGGMKVNGQALSQSTYNAQFSGGSRIGHASANEIIDDANMNGGMLCNGSTSLFRKLDEIASGGITLGFTAPSEHIAANALRGGAKTGGVCNNQVIYNASQASGIRINGKATQNIAIHTVQKGGLLSSGKYFIGIQLFATGGLSTSGSFICNVKSSNAFTRGVATKGIARHNIIDEVKARGGCKVRSKTTIERIWRVSKNRYGYGRAMGSDNILTKPKSTKTQLIRPTKALVPELSEHRFRMQHQPTWCDFDRRATSCDATLPKIVQNRQGKYLPPKNRDDVPRNNQIAAL